MDTSALVKLVVQETETAALRAWLAEERRGPVWRVNRVGRLS